MSSKKKQTAETIEEKVETPAEEAAGESAQEIPEEKAETPAEEVVSDEPVVKQGGRKIKVKDFFGSYKDAHFDDDGVCRRISDETLDALKSDFPGAEIEVID